MYCNVRGGIMEIEEEVLLKRLEYNEYNFAFCKKCTALKALVGPRTKRYWKIFKSLGRCEHEWVYEEVELDSWGSYSKMQSLQIARFSSYERKRTNIEDEMQVLQ